LAYGGKRRLQTNEHFKSLAMVLPSFNLLSIQIRFSLDGLILFKIVWFNFFLSRRLTMTYVVTAHCNGCKYTDCVEVCPVEAFHEGPEMVYINPESCIDCNACVEECPVEAIYADVDLPEKYQEYLEINADKSQEFPVISEKSDPLPTARTLEEIKAAGD
jgi:ferredoxin